MNAFHHEEGILIFDLDGKNKLDIEMWNHCEDLEIYVQETETERKIILVQKK